MKEINQTILELRENKGATQSQVGEYLGLDASGYGKLERGVTDITLTKLEKLAQFYGMSVIDLLAYPDKYVPLSSIGSVAVEEKVALTIELKKEKKEQVLRLVFGDNNLEIFNK